MVAKSETQRFKEKALRNLPKGKGVYALCDLDEVPIYVGRSVDGIAARVRRHLTSARSDQIANRQIDVWEIAFVWAWPREDIEAIKALEDALVYRLNKQSPLTNGSIPTTAPAPTSELSPEVRSQIMPDEQIEARKSLAMRFPRQIQHFGALVDYILNTQDKPHLRRAVQVHFERLARYHGAFLDE